MYTTLGIEPRTNSNPGRYGNPYSVCWFKKNLKLKTWPGGWEEHTKGIGSRLMLSMGELAS